MPDTFRTYSGIRACVVSWITGCVWRKGSTATSNGKVSSAALPYGISGVLGRSVRGGARRVLGKLKIA